MELAHYRKERAGKAGIHPQPGQRYYGCGKDTVEGYRWIEPVDGVGKICVLETELELIQDVTYRAE
ncbi:MAG TPA: hypothetical protein VGQ24_13300 [Gemmatimonadales bacterium]|nr:hypothetical protein [Gemmatimonadales bacterium]